MESLAKFLKKVIPQKWEVILKDPRKRVIRWELSEIIGRVVEGLASGCQNLRGLEVLTSLNGSRLPDTSVRDVLIKIDPAPLKLEIAKRVKAASRNHELDSKEGLPLNLVAIDGKRLLTTNYAVNEMSSGRSNSPSSPPRYLHQVVRAVIVSSKLKLHLGQRIVDGSSNEMAALPEFLDELQSLYGRTDLLEVFSLDFGFMSKCNAQKIIDMGCHYIISLKDPKTRKKTTRYAKELLQSKTVPDYSEEEKVNGRHIKRNLYRCKVSGIQDWEHAREFWRIEKITTYRNRTSTENFYKITSLPPSKLSNRQVLLATRLHWNIENNAHWVQNAIFEEANAPWCPPALELMSLLRIIVYNALARLKIRKLSRIAKPEFSTWKFVVTIVERIFFSKKTVLEFC